MTPTLAKPYWNSLQINASNKQIQHILRAFGAVCKNWTRLAYWGPFAFHRATVSKANIDLRVFEWKVWEIALHFKKLLYLPAGWHGGKMVWWQFFVVVVMSKRTGTCRYRDLYIGGRAERNGAKLSVILDGPRPHWQPAVWSRSTA